MEYLDIIDLNGKVIGKEEKHQAHLTGLWHQTFHCWVIHNDQIVLQLRANDKLTHPGKLDISAAGHVSAGESLLEGGLRELAEEVGLAVKADDLVCLGRTIGASDISTKKGLYKNREHVYTYFLKDDTPLSDYDLQDEELDGVYLVSPSDLIALFSGVKDHINIQGYSFYNAKMKADMRTVSVDDFVMHTQGYYIKIAIMVERFLQGLSIAI